MRLSVEPAYANRGRTAVGDQAERHLVGRESRFRRAEHRLHKLVVEERRPHAHLRALERQVPVVMPGCLSEHAERELMPLRHAFVRVPGLVEARPQSRLEETRQETYWLERAHVTEH